ncbi:hypothetical protein ACFQ2B_04705 [Streptomyces stramineus]
MEVRQPLDGTDPGADGQDVGERVQPAGQVGAGMTPPLVALPRVRRTTEARPAPAAPVHLMHTMVAPPTAIAMSAVIPAMPAKEPGSAPKPVLPARRAMMMPPRTPKRPRLARRWRKRRVGAAW